MEELIEIVSKEQKDLVKPEDAAKIVYFRDYCIADYHLQQYDYTNIEEAKKRIPGKLQQRKE